MTQLEWWKDAGAAKKAVRAWVEAAAPHQPHSATSRAAATAIAPDLNELQARVLGVIRLMGQATDEQLQHALRMNPSTQRPRRIELAKLGLIRDSGRTAPTRSGRQAVLWEPA
jgi:hypothetical protein